MSFRPPGECPNCGEDVPARAKSCRHCGATADAGWDESSGVEGLNLPDEEDFDYDAFAEREFGTPNRKKKVANKLWLGLALVLAASFVWLAWGWIF